MSDIEFHAVAKTGDLDEGEALQVIVGRKEIAIYNLDGEFYATDDICTHAYASLADGYVEGELIECPLHGGCFDIKTGKAMTPPVTEDIKTYEVKIDGEQILVGVPTDGIGERWRRMADDRTFVIIGGGQSGGWTAKTLRGEGFEGRILLIADEPYIPHERPPLSKEVLLGDQPPESTFLWPAESYDESNIELRLGMRATRISPAEHRIEIDGGESISYDRLMIATGARVRRLPVTGAELAGVHYLRGIRDTEAIRADLAADARVLVVGGGWIGLEVASAASRLGGRVTVVEALSQLCGRALTPDLADWVLALHRGHGVDVRLETSVERFEGDGRIARAVLSDGTSIEADLAVIGIGVIPNVELAAEAGLEIDNGIVVDELGRTSDPDIFASGDVTNHPNALLGRRIRLESWENAQNQAIATAKTMLDTGTAYAEIPWFWSDQYDVNIQLVGLPDGWSETVTRGDREAGQFILFYLKDGRIDGAAAINNPRDIRFARRLMAAGKVVDAAQLADPDIKLQALLKG